MRRAPIVRTARCRSRSFRFTMPGEAAGVVEFKAGLERAIAEGLLELHRSGTYAIFTPKGTDGLRDGIEINRIRTDRFSVENVGSTRAQIGFPLLRPRPRSRLSAP